MPLPRVCSAAGKGHPLSPRAQAKPVLLLSTVVIVQERTGGNVEPRATLPGGTAMKETLLELVEAILQA